MERTGAHPAGIGGPRKPVMKRALWVVLVIFAQMICRSLEAMEKGNYAGPDVGKYVSVSQSEADGDGDGVQETHIVRYRNLAGDRIFTMTSKGSVWAWSLDTSGDADSVVGANYVIRDSDCDGVFDERYAIDEEFHVPPCVK